MIRQHEPFAPGEWYHCYNRGVEKRITFSDKADYRRFQMLLSVANDETSFHNTSFSKKTLAEILSEEMPKNRLIEIGAYCLMPNHFHLLLRENTESGISRFMQKALTAYTMYFNKRNERTGPLFAGVFKSRHVSYDTYFQHLIAYIHLNPAVMADRRWKNGKVNRDLVETKLKTYPYSSLFDFLERGKRIESKILSESIFDIYNGRTITQMIRDAQEYREQIANDTHSRGETS